MKNIRISLILSLLPLLVSTSDNNFCGSTWQDASSSCEERQHCPTGSDNECTVVPGSICFADTLCDASLGHGSKALVAGVAHLNLLDIPHEDVRNRKFCGSWWAAAQENCALDTFCGNDQDGCKDFGSCYDTQCHIQDIVAAELGADWKEMLTDGLNADGTVKLDEKDARRNNFCGTSWADATDRCGTWCLGEDTDCPGNEKCFGDTGCYYDADLVPSMSPTLTPPTTKAPFPTDDPINNQFCGETWAEAIENCTPETNCRNNEDCIGAEMCHGYLPGCSLSEMSKEIHASEKDPSKQIYIRPNDPRNHYFCGESADEAINKCSLDTHCPDSECPKGRTCFQFINLDGCDAYAMWMNTSEPTPVPLFLTESPITNNPIRQPTKEPIIEPTEAPVEIVYGLCARDEEHLQQIYRSATECSNVEPCPEDLTCMQDIDFESAAQKNPSKAPSEKPSQKPLNVPSLIPTKAHSKPFFTLSPVLGPGKEETQTLPSYMASTESPVPSGALVGYQDSSGQPHFTVSSTPTYAEKVRTFYCAANIAELEKSCNSAVECSNNVKCPEGQGCIHYDCSKNINKQQDTDILGNNIPDECPVDFVGYTSSSAVNCKLYFECDDGKIGEANVCDDGLKYDLLRGMCWYENEVDSDCRGPPLDTDEPTMQPSAKPTYDKSNLTCPKNYTGTTSSSDSNCKVYYDCKNGEVGTTGTCRDKLKYDIVRQMCWYEDDVNEWCYGPPSGQSHHEQSELTFESDTSNQTFTCFDGQTGWSTHDGCKTYFWCEDGVMERDILYCIEGLLFDVIHGTCKHSSDVHCNETLNKDGTSKDASMGYTMTDKSYAWPDTGTSHEDNDRGSEKEDWYSRTQVYLNSPGYCLTPGFGVLTILSFTYIILYY